MSIEIGPLQIAAIVPPASPSSSSSLSSFIASIDEDSVVHMPLPTTLLLPPLLLFPRRNILVRLA
ncbi:hypothetical protein L202_02411 [Cryptococcus amylolentus CBS 6039]|uniref:Uncharacterized protein n=2 Tax=Cryptococcus amylolentus TaxID=104669 RepID=A0A1E3I0H4_9TREE|nr:hypothetical protein L202_02411 [Cryptococcus amylolentus CBS 6039]ODN82102.1 hypothetical protein L202_02411 [Cryptococcus amylolentus CBS 6039]ODO09787.1 hypothetical protein I350_02004 [Cryptococcus amylolentus CBS 6273]